VNYAVDSLARSGELENAGENIAGSPAHQGLAKIDITFIETPDLERNFD
jgi:hypothetical protein